MAERLALLFFGWQVLKMGDGWKWKDGRRGHTRLQRSMTQAGHELLRLGGVHTASNLTALASPTERTPLCFIKRCRSGAVDRRNQFYSQPASRIPP